MKQLNLFIELTRLKRPIGYMLLFWPCAWGLTLAYDFSEDLSNYYFYLTLFFLGSILMRSAGCIMNDILDRDFDTKVLRTKSRPIASGKVSIIIDTFPDAMGLLFVLKTFVSKSLSKMSFMMHPADLIRIDPKKNKVR